MPDTPRRYSDHEFALILRKAADLANHAELAPPSADGLTLAEMQAAAAQAGIDPALVERASRMVALTPSRPAVDRLLGGPLRHDANARFPRALDEQRAARLLSAVRIAAATAGSKDVGHASAVGMTWHDGGETESLIVTASAEDGETAITVALDRRGALISTAMFTGMGMFFAGFIGFMATQLSTELGVAVGVAGMSGALAVARSYWAASTRTVRARIDRVMDAVGKVLDG